MAGLGVSLEVLIDKGITDGFVRIKRELREAERLNASPAWLGPLGKFEADQQKQTWSTEGAASGEKWPTLEQGQGNMRGYIKWKRRNWPGRKLNVWRGDTRDSFRELGAPDHIARARGGVLEFGSKAKLAREMNDGYRGGWRTVYLRERSPLVGRNRRTGAPTKGRNWFAFRFKEIPARPLARKSDNQKREIKRAALKYMLAHVAQGTPGLLGRELGKMADRLRPDPRA